MVTNDFLKAKEAVEEIGVPFGPNGLHIVKVILDDGNFDYLFYQLRPNGTRIARKDFQDPKTFELPGKLLDEVNRKACGVHDLPPPGYIKYIIE